LDLRFTIFLIRKRGDPLLLRIKKNRKSKIVNRDNGRQGRQSNSRSFCFYSSKPSCRQRLGRWYEDEVPLLETPFPHYVSSGWLLLVTVFLEVTLFKKVSLLFPAMLRVKKGVK